MTKAQKVIAAVAVVLAVASIVLMVLVILDHNKEPEVVEEEPVVVCPMEDGVVTYAGEADKTALEILRSWCDIETQEVVGGEKVVRIDEVAVTGSEYWAFYVNDAYANINAGEYLTVETDVITWRLEAVGQ